jgi:hypothetical protein
MFAASAAYVRDFLASGAIGEVPVARREPEGVKRLEKMVRGNGSDVGGNRREVYSAELTFGEID